MINPIKWTPEISTGIVWQDYQHKELLEVINALRERVSAEKNTASSNIKSIDFLIFYTGDHFGIEEGYMDLLDYPEAAHHKEQHTDFLNKVRELKELSSFSVGIKTEGLFNDLAKWFYMHVNSTDQRFGSFLKANGIR